MTKLSVPLVRQAEGSSDCGPACLAMLLAYYKVSFSFDEMKKELGTYSWGTVTPQVGTYLLKRGFSVEIITMHPSLFSLFSSFKNTDELKRYLWSLKPLMKGECDPIALDHFLQFVDAGGTITPRVPLMSDIEVEVNEERPVFIPLTHWFLHNTDLPPRFSIHFNVVTGIDQENVYVNDPDWGEEFGGQHAIDRDAFLYAMYASAKGGVDDACIMKVRKF
ncbi:MAG: C39 family peptidase [bacterium]|nr:C39 family peptidase [bacterium]